jgi:hypothetical protein
VTLDAALNMFLAVIVPGAMAVMGGILAAKSLQTEPGKKNWAMWGWSFGFMFFFVSSVILAFVQQVRITSKETAAEEKTHQSELRSTGEIKYMEGQIDTMNRALGTLAANSDPKQNALLFKALLSASITPKRDTASLGNLASRCDKLSKDILQFVVNQNFHEPIYKLQEKRKIWAKENEDEFRKYYYPEAKNIQQALKGLNFEDAELNRIMGQLEKPSDVYISIEDIKRIGEGFGRLAEQVRSAKQ